MRRSQQQGGTAAVVQAWPDTTNTGPRGTNAKPSPFVGSFVDYTPPNPMVANTVVDGKNFLGGISAVGQAATGCKFTRCQSLGQSYDIEDNNNIVFEDCEFHGQGLAKTVGYNGYTMRRCYVHGGGDGCHGHGDVLWEDCYLTNTFDAALGGHEQTVYVGGANNVTPPGESAVVTFRHCTLESDMGSVGAQAVLSLLLDFVGNLDSVIVDNCKLKFIGTVGGNSLFSFFGKTNFITSIKVRNCVIDPGTLTPAAWISGDTNYTITEWTNNKFISGPNNGKTLNSDGTVT